MSNYYRKVVVGESLERGKCMVYAKGTKYKLKGELCELSDIIDSEHFENKVNMFVISDGNKVLWKTIDLSKTLEIEYDVNFE